MEPKTMKCELTGKGIIRLFASNGVEFWALTQWVKELPDDIQQRLEVFEEVPDWQPRLDSFNKQLRDAQDAIAKDWEAFKEWKAEREKEKVCTISIPLGTYLHDQLIKNGHKKGIHS